MKIKSVQSLSIEDVKVITFEVFRDERGYFTETFRKREIEALDGFSAFKDGVLQANQSESKTNVCRGLHFQWNPFMGKLVRTLSGRMVDVVVDIRKNSQTFGCGIMYDMPSEVPAWIWVPPGFAHGNYFTMPSVIEYFCTGDYSPGCEAGLCPTASDIDWSLADPKLSAEFKNGNWLLSAKDKAGFTLQAWKDDPRSENFRFKECV